MFNSTTLSIFTALFLTAACGGKVIDTTAEMHSSTPPMCDTVQAESQLSQQLNDAYFAGGDMCAAGRDTCLSPLDSCDACQAIYCCDLLAACVSGGGCAPKDQCMFQYCPVCSRTGVVNR